MSGAGDRAAWVNWNPDPDIHTLDRVLPRGVAIATCGITVRKQLGEPFDPTHPKACEDCAAGRKRSIDLNAPGVIVCTRVGS